MTKAFILKGGRQLRLKRGSFKPSIFLLSLLFPLILLCVGCSHDSVIPADDPRIQYSGRIDHSNPQAMRFDWPGVSITVAFHGNSIGFLLTDAHNGYDVILDNRLAAVWFTDSKTTTCFLDHLAPGDHVVKIIKRTEALFGTAIFRGVVLSEGETLLPAPELPRRRLEIIGDSYLCGYGVEAPTEQCDYPEVYENATKSFGILTAESLGTEYHLEAYSGKDYVGDSMTNITFEKLKYIQDSLTAKGVLFLVVFAPSQANFYPEYIPDAYHGSPATNYLKGIEAAKRLGVNYIDFNKWFADMKGKSTYPLYSKAGSHWTTYGAYMAFDSLNGYVEYKLKIVS